MLENLNDLKFMVVDLSHGCNIALISNESSKLFFHFLKQHSLMFVIYHEVESFNSENVQGPEIRQSPVTSEIILTLGYELAHPSDISHGHSLS